MKKESENTSQDSGVFNKGATRRRFVQSIGLGTAVTIGAPRVAAVDSAGVELLTGEFDNPIENSDIQKARTVAAERAGVEARAYTTYEPSISSYDLQIDEDRNIIQRTPEPQPPIVAFGFVVDENGRTHQVSGTAGDEHSVDSVQQSVQNDIKEALASNDSISTTSSGYWEEIHNDTDYYKEKPYGKIANGHIWYELKNDRFDNYIPFAIQGRHYSKPGREQWGNDWLNLEATSKHDWSPGDPDRIQDYAPSSSFDTSSGSETKENSLTIDSQSVEWKDVYIEDVHLQDNTNSSSKIAEWETDYFGKSQDANIYWKPGSAVLVPDQDGGSEKVVDLFTYTTFNYDGNSDAYELSYRYGLIYNF